MSVADSLPDLRDLQRGDENAWTDAFHFLWPCAYHAALNARGGTTPEEAEDLAIEAMRQLVGCIDTVKTAEGLKALLVVITRRRAISLVRSENAVKRPRVAVHLDALPGREAEQIVNREDTTGPRTEAEAAELLALLNKALNGLDVTARELILAQAVEGLTNRELSERFNLPQGTVSVKIMRGLQCLRLRLKETPGLLKELEAFLR
jgi:RNA polymerase sigma factor (sigma-70 family)